MTNPLPNPDAAAVIAELRTRLSDATYEASVLTTLVDGFQQRATRLDTALGPLRAALQKAAPAEQIVALVRDLLDLPAAPVEPSPPAKRTRRKATA